MITLPLKGGCQCGQLRYEINALPQTLYCCHCTECQAQSASAFGTSLRCDGASVKLSGEAKSFRRDKGRSTEVECLFCPYCGSRVLHRRDSSSVDCSIKGGSLDDKHGMEPVGHIWTRSKQGWVELPDETLQFETQPEDGYVELIAAFSKRYGP
ncbi:GFA family protein [Pseudahrensia aquimaris]|uniref:GFA family protein n=1 Tax=Pseudahrensia aquimaris TaxID=744461 RepID=A0ABW3FCA1_9HYPH